MKLNLLTTLFLLIPFVVLGQGKPKTHVYYDTVKTVHERVDYSPDTIAVYFKELIITKLDTSYGIHLAPGQCYEKWQSGFVVWQTYKKSSDIEFSSGFRSTGTLNQPAYYRDEYEPSKGLPGQFLYADKRPCKNIVLNSFKR